MTEEATTAPINKTAESQPRTRPLSTVEIENIAGGIDRVWGEDPEYRRLFDQEASVVETILKELTEGKISRKNAINALAARNAESKVARGIDSLMDIPNRAELDRRLTEVIGLSRRSGKPVTVGFADLDDFKGINDAPGVKHEGGDAVLRAWGETIKGAFRRDTDFAGRYGGEEIVFVFPNASEEWATEFIDALRTQAPDQISEAVSEQGFQLPHKPTMTVGVFGMTIEPSDSREPGEIMREMVGKADERMYLGKKSGKNTVVNSLKEQQLKAKPVL